MNIKKITSFLLMSLLLISSIFVSPAFAQENSGKSSNGNQTLVSINKEDIDNYPEVKEMIIEKGFQHLLQTEAENDEVQYEQLELSQLDTTSIPENLVHVLENIGEDKLRIASEKYGLQMPGTQDSEVILDEHFLVSYNDVDSRGGNVWLLRYSVDDTGFKINVTNVGTDKLDRISGSVQMYNKSGKNWVAGTRHTVAKSQVGNGVADHMKVSKTNVSDYFEYNLTLTEDGQTFGYSNSSGSSKYAHQRYNFAVGPYKSITASGGERHHLVSDASLNSSGFNANNAPTIRMLAEDHYKTPNWGNSTTSTNFRAKELALLKAKKYEELIKLEVDTFKSLPDPEGKFNNLGAKYGDYLVVCVIYLHDYFGIPL